MSIKYELEEMILIYDLISNHFDEYESKKSKAPIPLQESLFLKSIHSKLNRKRTIGAIAEKLSVSKDEKRNKRIIAPLFIKIKDKVIYRNDEYKKSDLLNFVGCHALVEKIESRINDEQPLFFNSNVIDEYSGLSNDIWNEVYEFSERDLTSAYINVYKMIKAGKAKYDKYGKLNLIKEESNNLEDKKVMLDNDGLKKELNKLRAENGKFYGFEDVGDSCIKFSNDGTGMGKSYSVIDRFISHSIDKNHNLIFSAPQKNQLTIDSNLALSAINKGIKIMQNMSISDLFDIGSVNMANRAIREANEKNNDLIKKNKKAKTSDEKDSQAEYLNGLVFKNGKFYSSENHLKGDVYKILKSLNIDLKNNDKDIDILKKRVNSFSSRLRSLRMKQDNIKEEKTTLKYITDEYERKIKESLIDRLDIETKNIKGSIQKEFASVICSLLTILEKALNSDLGSLYSLYNNDKENKSAFRLIKLFELFMPFEAAKYNKSIILTTSDKFKYRVYTIVKSRGRNIVKSVKVDNLIGYKDDLKIEYESNHNYDMYGDDFGDSEAKGLMSNISSSEDEKSDIIKKQFLTIDKENDFYKRDIYFTVVIDEEHDAYTKFDESTISELITKNNNIEHIISSAARMCYSDNKDSVNIKFKKNIEKGVEKHLNKTQGYDDITIEDVRKMIKNVNHMFEKNNCGMYIKSGHVNIIENITKNNFIFSESKSFSQEFLRHVKFKNESLGKVVMFYDNEVSDGVDDVNLFTISCIIVGIIYAVKEVGFSDDESNFVALAEREEGGENQNSPLTTLLNKRKSLKESAIADTLFSEKTFEDFEIDYFYVYFINKLFLNLTTIENVGKRFQVSNKSELFEGDIRVRIKVEVITYPPEVSLLKILHNTKNKIITLSATSGMLNCKNGNYDRDFFSYYEKFMKFDVKDKSKGENNIPLKIRKKREEIRDDISVEFFDFEKLDKEKNISSINQKRFNIDHDDADVSLPNNGGTINSETFINQIKIKLNQNLEYKNKFKKESEKMFLHFLKESFNSGENTFILTLRKSIVEDGIKLISSLDKDSKKDSEKYHLPLNVDGKRCRVIFYNSDIAKYDSDWERNLSVESEKNEFIIFISYYKAAGTGVNIFINDLSAGVKRDFDRVVIVDSPYHSSIKDSGFSSLNNTKNNFLLLRDMAAKNASAGLFDDKIKLSIFKNPYLLNLKYRDYLYKEHYLSNLKEMMQAIGRVERTDNNKHTRMFLNSRINEYVYQISKDIKYSNKDYYKGISLLNANYIDRLIESIEKHSIDDNRLKELNNAYIRVAEYFDDYDNVRGYRKSVLMPARLGCKLSIEFNQLLRSKNAYKDPIKYKKDLINSEYFKQCDFKEHLKDVINSFYFDLSSNAILYQNKSIIYSEHGFSEVAKYIDCKNKNYSNKNYIITDPKGSNGYDFMQVLKLRDWYEGYSFNDEVENVLSKNKIKLKQVINPAFHPLIKGSLAENIVDDWLFTKSVEYIDFSKDEDMEKYHEVYEVFDRYVISDNKVICIDVKSYSETTIQGKHIKFENKKNDRLNDVKNTLIKKESRFKDMRFIAVYLNVTGTLSDGVEMNNTENKNIYNSMFFSTDEKYRQKYKQIQEDKQQKDGTRMEKKVCVSRILKDLIKGEK